MTFFSTLASRTKPSLPCARYRIPPCNNRLERLLVPKAKSYCSTSPTRNPRIAASRAIPEPTIPPPMIKRSSGWDVSDSIVRAREFEMDVFKRGQPHFLQRSILLPILSGSAKPNRARDEILQHRQK